MGNLASRRARRSPFVHGPFFYLFFGLFALLLGVLWSGELSHPKQTEAQIIPRSVNVFATLGRNYFTLYGYASPQALIKLEGIGLYAETFSNEKGYFEFHDEFSPFLPREACLTGQDQLGRISSPLCLPPFETEANVTIGPVILPPTLSLNKGIFYVSDEAVVSGQSIPDSPIYIVTFVDNNLTTRLVRKFNLIRPVEALNIPQLEARTDALGNFSVALPSSRDTRLRIFAQTAFDNSPSPKSNTLQITFLPLWMIIVNLLRFLWESLLGRLLEIILITELVLLTLYLMRVWILKHILPQKSLLVSENDLPILVEPALPAVIPSHSLILYHRSDY